MSSSWKALALQLVAKTGRVPYLDQAPTPSLSLSPTALVCLIRSVQGHLSLRLLGKLNWEAVSLLGLSFSEQLTLAHFSIAHAHPSQVLKPQPSPSTFCLNSLSDAVLLILVTESRGSCSRVLVWAWCHFLKLATPSLSPPLRLSPQLPEPGFISSCPAPPASPC